MELSIFKYFSSLCEPCKDKHYEILYHTDKNYSKSVLKCKLIFFISLLPLKIIGEFLEVSEKPLNFTETSLYDPCFRNEQITFEYLHYLKIHC